jgi:hypothetical protein
VGDISTAQMTEWHDEYHMSSRISLENARLSDSDFSSVYFEAHPV